MTTRRRFLATAGSTLAATAVSSGQKTPGPLLSFGLMADCQYADADPNGIRFYRESTGKLRAAVEELNRHDLAFTFHLGDFIDRDIKSFDVLDPIVANLKSNLHHALGNHDYEVAADDKALIPGKLGLAREYYSVTRPGFRFIVIDTTDVSLYRFPGKAPGTVAAQAELKTLKAAGSPSAKPWSGRPGDEQIVWIDSELKAATAAGENALVLGHHPIMPDNSHSVWNAAPMNRLFQKHTCAKAYLNGHNHAGAYTSEEGLHYLTLDGMLNTEDQNAFAVVDLYPDRMELTGFGRQESHTMKFR